MVNVGGNHWQQQQKSQPSIIVLWFYLFVIPPCVNCHIINNCDRHPQFSTFTELIEKYFMRLLCGGGSYLVLGHINATSIGLLCGWQGREIKSSHSFIIVLSSCRSTTSRKGVEGGRKQLTAGQLEQRPFVVFIVVMGRMTATELYDKEFLDLQRIKGYSQYFILWPHSRSPGYQSPSFMRLRANPLQWEEESIHDSRSV